MLRGRRDWKILGLAALTATMLVPAQVSAQNYPERAVTVVVPFSAGGTLDTVARLWADRASRLLGDLLVVENRGGAGGTIGTGYVARADADGYTLGVGMTGTMVLNPILMSDVTYDPGADFQLISILATTTNAFAVILSVPAETMEELVAYMRDNQDQLSYCSAGAGTSTNLAGELLKEAAGAGNIVHVPYGGAGDCIGAVVSGDVPIASVVFTGSLHELHKGGNLRILSVASQKRLTTAPDIPTTVELGLPDLTMDSFTAILVPAATPQAVVDKLYEVTQQVMADPDMQAALINQGLEPVTDSSPEAAQAYLATELQRLTPYIQNLSRE